MTSFHERQRAVWLVTPEWYGQGGVGDYTHFLACHLITLGYSVAVFGPSCGMPSAETSYAWREVPGAWSLRALLHLVRLARTEHPDIVHLQFVPHGFQPHGLPTPLCLLPLLLRLRSASLPVVTFHELFVPWESGIVQRTLGLLQRIQALLLAAVSCVVIVTLDERAAFLGRRLRHKQSVIYVVPVGSNIRPARLSYDERRILRERLFGSDDVFVLGIFSPQHPGVDLEGVITALAELPQPVRLLVIGRVPPERWQAVGARARALGTAQRICWTGTLTEQAASQALQAVDVYIHAHRSGPSLRSTSLAAALAHSLPVIAYSGPEAYRSIYRDGEHLLLTPVGAPCLLADAVERLRRDAGLRYAIASRGRSLYERTMGWEKITKSILHVYTVAKQKSNPGRMYRALDPR